MKYQLILPCQRKDVLIKKKRELNLLAVQLFTPLCKQ